MTKKLKKDLQTHPVGIDWPKWAMRRQVAIHEAAFLSLGIDPDKRGPAYHLDAPDQPLRPEFRDSFPKRFQKLQEAFLNDESSAYDRTLEEIAHSKGYTDAYTEYLRLDTYDFPRRYWLFSLPKLARWCQEFEFEIPDELAHFSAGDEKTSEPLYVWDLSPEKKLLERLSSCEPEERITVVEYPFNGYNTVTITAKAMMAEVREQIENYQCGYYSVGQAAKALADLNPSMSCSTVVSQIKSAVTNGSLRTYPGRGQFPHKSEYEIRAFESVVKISDLNDWLDSIGIEFRLACPSTDSSKSEYGDAIGDGTTIEAPASAEHDANVFASEVKRGITKSAIVAVEWPLTAKYRQSSLERDLGDSPKWLLDAQVAPGKRGGPSARWSPVLLAVCLHDRRYVSLSALDRFMAAHFADWSSEWAERSESLR